MKKVLFLTVITAIGFAACGGNESAYTEQEKTSQDSVDQIKQEDDFESLMNDTASKDSVSLKPEKYTPAKSGEAVTIPSK